MRFHWQNLQAYKPGMWNALHLHGRAWWYFEKRTLRVEWLTLTHFFHAKMELGGGENNEDLQISIGCGLFAFWWTITAPKWLLNCVLPYRVFTDTTPTRESVRLYRIYEPRELSVAWYDKCLHLDLWVHPNSWSSGEPRWRRWRIAPLDLLFGRIQYKREEINDSRSIGVHMPEGIYTAIIKTECCTWWRPRWPVWPFYRQAVYHDVQIPIGIPFSGKGENSWDCGDDGLYGTSFDAARCPTDDQVENEIIGRCLKYRRERGDRMIWPETPDQRLLRISTKQADRLANELRGQSNA